jgi:hypothetical protein
MQAGNNKQCIMDIQYKSEKRMLTVNGSEQFNTLQKYVAQLFNLTSPFTLHYEDEEGEKYAIRSFSSPNFH